MSTCIRAQQGEFRTHKGISLLDLKYRKEMAKNVNFPISLISNHRLFPDGLYGDEQRFC